MLLIGTNDIELKADPAMIAGNVKQIIAALRQHNPAMPVILCEVFPSSLAKNRPAQTVRKLNALYMEAAADEPQVTVLDTWSLFANLKGDAKDEEMPDLLHPDIVGYAKWASALRPIFETVGLVPAWQDEFIPESGFESLFDGHDLSGWGYAQRLHVLGQAGERRRPLRGEKRPADRDGFAQGPGEQDSLDDEEVP